MSPKKTRRGGNKGKKTEQPSVGSNTGTSEQVDQCSKAENPVYKGDEHDAPTETCNKSHQERKNIDLHEPGQATTTMSVCLSPEGTLSCAVNEPSTVNDESYMSKQQRLVLDEDVSQTEDEEVIVRRDMCCAVEEMVSGCARERLMCQINSLLRDSEPSLHYRPKFSDEEILFTEIDINVSADNQEDNLISELDEEAMESSHDALYCLDDSSRGIACDINNDEVSINTSEDLIEEQSACVASNEYFSIEENEILEEVLKLLLNLKDVCCKKDQLTTLNVEGDESPSLLASSSDYSLEEDDDADLNMKDYIRQMLRVLGEFLEKRRFSSAMKMEVYLKVVEKLKAELDKECWHRFLKQTVVGKESKKSEDGSFALDFNIEDAKSFDEAIFLIYAKASHMLQILPEKFIQWQEFNEIRAELDHEFAQELHLLDSIKGRISCDTSVGEKSEAERDLLLVEKMLTEYESKMTTLKKCNRGLAGYLYADVFDKNRSHVRTLANELLNIKTSCARLRQKFGHPEMLPASEKILGTEDIIQLQTDRPTEDIAKLSDVSYLLKLALLLLLFILLVVFFLDLRWRHVFSGFRLPVPLHLRHVGTNPPI